MDLIARNDEGRYLRDQEIYVSPQGDSDSVALRLAHARRLAVSGLACAKAVQLIAQRQSGVLGQDGVLRLPPHMVAAAARLVNTQLSPCIRTRLESALRLSEENKLAEERRKADEAAEALLKELSEETTVAAGSTKGTAKGKGKTGKQPAGGKVQPVGPGGAQAAGGAVAAERSGAQRRGKGSGPPPPTPPASDPAAEEATARAQRAREEEAERRAAEYEASLLRRREELAASQASGQRSEQEGDWEEVPLEFLAPSPQPASPRVRPELAAARAEAAQAAREDGAGRGWTSPEEIVPPPPAGSDGVSQEWPQSSHQLVAAEAADAPWPPPKASRGLDPAPALAAAAGVPLFLQSLLGAPAPSVAQPPAALPPWLSASSPAPAPAAASAYSAPWAPAPVQPAVAAGLANSVGENNCFLNVVLQSLFGCERFSRRLLLDAGDHRCGGRPEECVTCGIVAVFTQMSTGGVADPGVLRRALDSAFQHTDLFRLSQMNDASETLHEIFNCLHRAFCAMAGPAEGKLAGGRSGRGGGARDRDRGGKYEVEITGHSMILDILGLDVYESLACRACRKATRKLRFTQLFHLAAVTPLTVLAATAAAESRQRPTLGSLLRMVEEHDARSCDKDEKGCGLVQPLHRKLREVPPLFTLILAWESGAADAAAISSLLDVLETSLRVEEAYSAVDRDTPVRSRTHHLRSMVAYYGAHYAAFVYSMELGAWRYVDDASVRVVGSWDDVKAQCERGRLQPLALFFEAA